MIYSFKVFGIKSVTRINNIVVDRLANVVARFTLLRDKFYMEMVYKPYILDNVTNLCVFMMLIKYCTSFLIQTFSKMHP